MAIISGDVDDSSVMGDAALGGQYGGAITYVTCRTNAAATTPDGCSRRSELCCRSSFADAPKTALLAMDPDRKLFHGPEARPLPPTNGVSWHGQLEFRPALEQSLQRALSLNPCQLVA